ncbi:hypothetical protein [Lentisphaera araneosa]|uniref:hypothetical protein n=1 Tax=Lentisphaera araneosa TaxID=256847 RepID=UPI0012FB1077|nr:hypothetical protein [Lentisphaera araneosa]
MLTARSFAGSLKDRCTERDKRIRRGQSSVKSWEPRIQCGIYHLKPGTAELQLGNCGQGRPLRCKTVPLQDRSRCSLQDRSRCSLQDRSRCSLQDRSRCSLQDRSQAH